VGSTGVPDAGPESGGYFTIRQHPDPADFSIFGSARNLFNL